MQLGNTQHGYGWVAIALHWIAVAGILAMFWFGLNADWAGDAGDRDARRAWMGLHVSLGVTLAAIFAIRVIAHYAQRQPDAPAQPKPLNLLASATHHLLLLAIVIQIVSGPLAVFSGGRGIDVWGLFEIPSPFAERNDALHEFAEVAHAVGRYMFYVLIPLHVLGVLKHVFIDRDGTLQRMLAPPRDKTV